MRADVDDGAFTVVRRGYDRTQVDEALREVRDRLSAVVAERDQLVGQNAVLDQRLEERRVEIRQLRAENGRTRTELDELRAQIADLSAVPTTVDGMSERLQTMLRVAQDEVNEMRSRATAGAAQLLALAEAEAAEMRERSQTEHRENEARRHEAEEIVRGRLAASESRLADLEREADDRQARLDAEIVERRTAAEQALVVETERRRTALVEELAALDAAQRAEACRIADSATRQAHARLTEATSQADRIQAAAREEVADRRREVEEMRRLQHHVAEQLTSVRALLDWAAPRMLDTREAETEAETEAEAPADEGAGDAEDRTGAAERSGTSRDGAAGDETGAADVEGSSAPHPQSAPADPPENDDTEPVRDEPAVAVVRRRPVPSPRSSAPATDGLTSPHVSG